MRLVYYSLTGQTRRFINKLGLEDSIELKRHQKTAPLSEDFILIVPTYESGLEFVDQFIADNQTYFKGVIGSGNRNFGPEFCHVAKRYADTYQVPILYEFEFNGTPEDVERVKGILNES